MEFLEGELNWVRLFFGDGELTKTVHVDRLIDHNAKNNKCGRFVNIPYILLELCIVVSRSHLCTLVKSRNVKYSPLDAGIFPLGA